MLSRKYMRHFYGSCILALIWSFAVGLLLAAQTKPRNDHPSLPKLFIVGDSTAHINGDQEKYGVKARVGWGTPFHRYFDPEKIDVINAASAGRSSRTYLREGKWRRVLNQLGSGDFVLIQFGHNDPGGVGTGKDRGSLPGVGNQTKLVQHAGGSVELVHTFGWYLRRYIADTRARGATPIILSVTPRNIWINGQPEEGLGHYRQWAYEVARQEQVEFVDVSRIVSQRYVELGQQKVASFFPLDHTHTDRQGAEVVARCVVAGLKGLPHHPFQPYLSSLGRAVRPVAPGYR